jgi:hypothetical protein
MAKSNRKHSKTPRSSSLGPSTRSATKLNQSSNVDSDGFTTVRKKSGSVSTHPPPLTAAQRKQLSISSPSSFDQDHDDTTTPHASSTTTDHIDHPPSDDYSTNAISQWQRFTSATINRPVSTQSHHIASGRPSSHQSSDGISFSDDSNRVPNSTLLPTVSTNPVIDAHRFKSMECQLAAMMDFIKKSEARHNEQLNHYGINVNPHYSHGLPTKISTPVPDQSCGTHVSHTKSASVIEPVHPSSFIPSVKPDVPENTSPPISSKHSRHSNPPKIQSQTTNSASILFGQSDFSVACNGKVKFLEIEKYMKDKKLENDSVQQLELFYTDLMSAVGYAFEFHLSFIPSFQDLRPNIDFQKLFLQNLHGATLQKAQSTFDRIGQILKKFLKAPFVQDASAPLASIVLKSNHKLPGWHLLTKLLCARVVLCGATPDYDLDTVRTSITFLEGETFHLFYSRNQDLLNEYELTYGEQIYIPTFKITYRFVTELCRSMDYLIHLSHFQHALIQHLQKFGDANNMVLPPCSIQEVYELLVRVRAPSIPTSLHSVTYMPPPSVVPSTPASSVHPTSDNNTIIAHMETFPSCQQPEICSMSHPKQRCQACLRGVHDPNDCFLRGPAFRPTELNQRINNYNQQFGDKPPKGHVPPVYKPLGLSAMHDKKSSIRPSKFSKKPFSGSTKIKFNDQKSSIHAIENSDDIPIATDAITPDHDSSHPHVGSFIQEEDAFYDQQLNADDTNVFDQDPTICMLSSSSHHLHTSKDPSFVKDEYSQLNITDMIHPQITQRIQKYHIQKGNKPCGMFVKHHQRNLQRIPHNCFQPFCDVNLMADGGANVWALTDRRCFYFYIEQESKITQAGGSGMPSKAWGGVLTQFGTNVYLVAPVYHCPQNPRNTFSPGVLIDFCGFRRVVIDTHHSVHMHDHQDGVHQLPITTHNNLDYVNIKILTLQSPPTQSLSFLSSPEHTATVNPTICSQTIVHQRRSPRLLQQQLKDPSSKASSSSTTAPLHHSDPSISQPNLITINNPRLDDNNEFILPKEAMMTIIHFFVDLHPRPSPRTQAINTINLFLGHHVPTSSALPQVHSLISPPSPLPSPDTVSPMINNLYSASNSSVTNHDKYLFLHEGLMHCSKRTIQTMIRRKLLHDLPSIKVTDFLCSCATCKLAKAKKLPRGLK